jgi:hypothetical protein
MHEIPPKKQIIKVAGLELLYFWALYSLIIIAPYGLVYLFPGFLNMIIQFVFVRSFTVFGYVLLAVVAVVTAFSFYWLKLKHQAAYGAVEIFIAQLTIATAIIRLGSLENEIATILQIFTGIYITIRGLDNVEKGLKESSSEPMINLWNNYFAKDIIGARILFFILQSFAISTMNYSFIIFFILSSIVSLADGLWIAEIKSKRPEPHGGLPRR